MIKSLLRRLLVWLIDNQDNPYHPLVWVSGTPEIAGHVYIGGFSEVYAKGARVRIGAHSDIASFVVINCNDSHLKTVELSEKIEKKDITIGEHVFIGTFSAVLGGTVIGHHSVIGAGVILKGQTIPPYSKVYRNEDGRLVILPGFYRPKHDD